MTIVALKKQTGFNQDFEFRCFGGKYQVLFFNQVSNRTNNKQEKIRIPCLPEKLEISMYVSFFTVKLTLAMEGPLVSRISTMAACPAHAARCNGLDPLSSALLQEAS